MEKIEGIKGTVATQAVIFAERLSVIKNFTLTLTVPLTAFYKRIFLIK